MIHSLAEIHLYVFEKGMVIPALKCIPYHAYPISLKLKVLSSVYSYTFNFTFKIWEPKLSI